MIELGPEADKLRSYMIAAAYAKAVADDPDRVMQPWAWSFAGRANEFIGEIFESAGEDWWSGDWTAWRAFISALFSEPFGSDEEKLIFQRCTRLEEQYPERITRAWVPVGRRGGKSRVFAAIAVYLACCYDWTPYLSAGEIGHLSVIAQDRKAAQTIMGYAKGFLNHPELKKHVAGDPAVESIKLTGSVAIEVITASYRAVRSRTVIAALCDEIAFWRIDDGSANPDHEIINGLEPSMATIPSALLLAASSPYARRGVLWENFQKHFGIPGPDLVWNAPTWVMHPSLREDGEFLSKKYQDDPLAAAAEYGAEFRTDVQAYVAQEVVDGCVVRDRREIPVMPSVSYQAFVDPSGGSADSFTLAIAHREGDTGVLDLIREWVPPFSGDSVAKEISDLLKVYRISRVKGDRYGGEWPRERFRANGIAYDPSEKPKSDIYLEFLPLLNAGRVELLDHGRMRSQLLSLDRKPMRSGKEVIDHPPRSNDDVINVVAGVLVYLLAKRDTMSVHPDAMRRAARTVLPGRVPMGGPVWR